MQQRQWGRINGTAAAVLAVHVFIYVTVVSCVVRTTHTLRCILYEGRPQLSDIDTALLQAAQYLSSLVCRTGCVALDPQCNGLIS